MSRQLAPNACCNIGTYGCTVPMPIKGRRQDVDLCIADIVAALNAANITTVASCCGHGKIDGNILLEDGRIINIRNVKRQEGEMDYLEFVGLRKPKKKVVKFNTEEKDTRIAALEAELATVKAECGHLVIGSAQLAAELEQVDQDFEDIKAERDAALAAVKKHCDECAIFADGDDDCAGCVLKNVSPQARATLAQPEQGGE